jgi:hypothetical protein
MTRGIDAEGGVDQTSTSETWVMHGDNPNSHKLISLKLQKTK